MSVEALVRFAEGDTWVCTIRDFCAGGMLLKGNRSRLLDAYDGTEDEPARGTPIDVHFSVADSDGQSLNFHQTGEIARTLEDGVGVMFPERLDDAAHRALTEFGSGASGQITANEEVTSRYTFDEATANKVALGCAKLTQRALLSMGNDFVEDFDKELQACLRRASTEAERDDFIHAERVLREHGSKLRSEFVGYVVEHVRGRKPMQRNARRYESERASKESSKLYSSSRLALIDKADFEHWLVLAEMVSDVEGRLSEELFILRTWLGLVCPAWANKDVNPLNPGAFIHSLELALSTLQLQPQAMAVAFNTFERSTRDKLKRFYERLLTTLTNTNRFPAVEEIISAQVKVKVEPVSPSRAGEPSGGEQGRSSGTGDTGNGNAGGGQGFAYDGVESAVRSPEAANALLEVAASLNRNADAQQAPPSSPPAGFDVDRILEVLSALPRPENNQRLDGGLKNALLTQLKSQGASSEHVPPRIVNALDMVDHMVSSVEEDQVLTQQLRDWFARLEVPLGQEAAKNDAFLNSTPENPHAAFAMLNQLETVDAGAAQHDVRRAVDGVLQKLVDDWSGDSQAFVQAVEDLEPIVEQQQKTYERNVDRVVNGCEGRARLKRAKQIVLKCLSALLEGHSVPMVLLDLLNPAWRNLLVNTALRDGIRSTVWKQQLQVVQRLVAVLCARKAKNPSPDTVRVLVKCVGEGLDAIGHVARVELLRQLEVELSDPQNRDRSQDIEVDDGDVARLLDWEQLALQADAVPPAIEGDDRKRYLETMRRVRVLRTGARIKFAAEHGGAQTSTLAWVSKAGDHFVFVNPKGLWDRELMLGALTDSLVEGRAELLDGYDVPLVERVSERMLSRIHGQIKEDAQRDELTALSNRRSFERSLEKLVALARHTDTRHCVLQIDLDQFKIINANCGYEGGDRLLKELAAVLSSEIAAEGGSVSRIGADEFAAILRETDVEQGEVIAQRIVRRVRHMSFAWEGSEHSVTTTIGLLGVDQRSEDNRALMQNLSSSCRAGKEQGGDCVYRFVEDDAAMLEQRASMQLAGQVETMLATGRVKLNCQKIGAIDSNDPMLGHYEVLITVLDEEGKPHSPVEFIEAAERYGKMPHVDRFVVSSALRWMAKHPDVVARFGGFSVNLSGQSIQQEDFLDFVLHAFEETGAPTSKVCFEVTETAAMGNLGQAAEFIQKIRVTGCRFSLDDFGTGMSSYAYLRELPVDYLKIDGTFVKNMAEDESDQAVVRSINEIGHFMGKHTVAEYVHNEATLDMARQIGVDFVQGWHIGKPQPIDTLIEEFSAAQAIA